MAHGTTVKPAVCLFDLKPDRGQSHVGEACGQPVVNLFDGPRFIDVLDPASVLTPGGFGTRNPDNLFRLPRWPGPYSRPAPVGELTSTRHRLVIGVPDVDLALDPLQQQVWERAIAHAATLDIVITVDVRPLPRAAHRGRSRSTSCLRQLVRRTT